MGKRVRRQRLCRSGTELSVILHDAWFELLVHLCVRMCMRACVCVCVCVRARARASECMHVCVSEMLQKTQTKLLSDFFVVYEVEFVAQFV